LLAGVFAVLLLASGSASAHIDLLEPEARAHGTAARGDTQIDENSNLKSGPCGQVASGRTERVATYAPGQTIIVRVREENAHVSYLRVALALDGESFPVRSAVPAAPETQAEASAAEQALGDFGLLAVVREDNDTAGFVHELQVTLPDTPCQRCTLQVLQFMYDDPAAPYYFQCADLVLAEGQSTGDAGGAAAPVPAGGSAGAAVEAAPRNSGAAMPPAVGGPGADAGLPAAMAPALREPVPAGFTSPREPSTASSADSGCSIDTTATTSGAYDLAALALALLIGRHRAKRQRGQASARRR
jgi:hypothetical protein